MLNRYRQPPPVVELLSFQRRVLAEIRRQMRPVFAFDNVRAEVSIHLELKGTPAELKLFIVSIPYSDNTLTMMRAWIGELGFGTRDTCRVMHVDVPRNPTLEILTHPLPKARRLCPSHRPPGDYDVFMW